METIGKHSPGFSTPLVLVVYSNKELDIQKKNPISWKQMEISKFIFILHWNDLTDLWKYLLEPFSLQLSGHSTCLTLEVKHEVLQCQLQAQN